MPAQSLDQLPTPCLLLEVDKLDANIARMRARLAGSGAALRPHVKTCKSIDVARRLFPGEAIGPITVSTLREAEYFAETGCRDILYAVSIVPSKLPRVAAVQQTGATVHVILDDETVARQFAEQAGQLDHDFSVLIELDCDGHRAGLPPERASEVVRLAQQIDAAPRLRLAGVLTHAGESYVCPNVEAIRSAAAAERDCVVSLAKQIEAAGPSCPVRSVGSSPTALLGDSLAGVSEVRAGVFVFQDLFQSNLGVCRVEDIALSVLCTVISHRRDKGWLITDAGALALSKDHGTAKQRKDYGFGLVCDERGRPLGEYLVDAANQEHGIITNHAGPVDFERFAIGSRLRILPNHACMTAAAHDAYHAIRGDAIEVWPRVNGW